MDESIHNEAAGGAIDPGHILERLKRTAQRQHHTRRLLYTLSALAIVAALAWRMTSLTICVWLALAAGAAARVVWLKRWLRTTLASFDDVRSAGFLAEALAGPNRHVVAQAEAALTILLPQIGAENAGILNGRQRDCLYAGLAIRHINAKADFMVAVLGALERIGDMRALPTVRALASCIADSSRCRQVKTAAESCLETLRNLEAKDDDRESLLRASVSALGTDDTLIRPVDDPDPGSLLRSSQTNAEADQLLRMQDEA